MNTFMSPIYFNGGLRVKFSKWLQFKKLKKRLKVCGFGFADLWEMAEFIKLAEEVCFYTNNINDPLFSSRNFKTGENGFIINTSKYRLVVKLFSDDFGVVMEINYRKDNESFKDLIKSFRFKNNDWCTDHTDYDAIIVGELKEMIYNKLIWLLDFCWNYHKPKFQERLLGG